MTTVSAIEQPVEDTSSLSASGTLASKRIRLASDSKNLPRPPSEHVDGDELENSHRKTPCNSADYQLDPIADIGQNRDPELKGGDNCPKDAIATKTETETDVYIAIINIVRPKESVFTAMQRLGEFRTASVRCCGKLSCIQPLREPFSTTPAERNARRQSSQELTALCDKMVAFGRFGIYEETYEEVVQTLRKAGVIAPDWWTGDPIGVSSRVAR